MDDKQISELRQRFQRAQQAATSAETLVNQAKANLDKAEVRLRELGIDPDRPVEEQIQAVVQDVETALGRIETMLGDARGILDG